MIEFKLPWRKGFVKTPDQINLGELWEGKLVSVLYGMTDGEATYLTDLWVQKEHRGKGCGTRLMREFIKRAGDTTIILLTTEATEFYKKFGFEERTAMVRKPTE